MTIEILAFLTILIIIGLALAVYRDYRRDKREFEASVKKLQETWMPINPERPSYINYQAMGWAKPVLYINTDELGMQSAAYAEYEDTPPFITDALERRADTELAENEELPDWARRWLEESEDGE